MKIAILRFAHADARHTYFNALRARMYTAGYEPHVVTEWIRAWFPGVNAKSGIVSGTADAERACDVATEVRGVMCKLREE